MKYRATKKDVTNGYYNIICLGFCDGQNLLSGLDPEAYTCGVYGWNADVYKINSTTALVTGYRPFGNIRPDYDTIREYEKAAEKITHNWNISYEERQKMLTEIRRDFFGVVLNK